MGVSLRRGGRAGDARSRPGSKMEVMMRWLMDAEDMRVCWSSILKTIVLPLRHVMELECRAAFVETSVFHVQIVSSTRYCSEVACLAGLCQ
jgi:hypothetical protein